jgi:hypothetical protein
MVHRHESRRINLRRSALDSKIFSTFPELITYFLNNLPKISHLTCRQHGRTTRRALLHHPGRHWIIYCNGLGLAQIL